jgi:DNA-binding transcriptional LysR family regulator
VKADLTELRTFIEVAQAGGFREAARIHGKSASGLSEATRKLEERLGVRLFNRTTRSVVPTEAGAQLLARLAPVFVEMDAALEGVTHVSGRPAGTLRLNVPTVATRLVLPTLLPAFLLAFPEIRVEVTADENFIDVLAAGCDAGIRYDERLELDMVAVPIGPRTQRFAIAASSAYLDQHGRPDHPRQLLEHACVRGRFPSGALAPWEFERDGEIIRIEPASRLLVTVGGATDLAVEAAIAGVGIIQLFEEWLQPYFDRGALEPVLEPWWQRFTGPYLYYPSRRLLPAPLRAFVEFITAKTGR